MAKDSWCSRCSPEFRGRAVRIQQDNSNNALRAQAHGKQQISHSCADCLPCSEAERRNRAR